MILLPIIFTLAQPSAQAAGASRPPPVVTIEIVRPDEFRRGSRVAVLVRTEADAFVTVFRIDTGRRLHVIFPTSPRETGRVRGGTNFRVPDPTGRLDDHTFVVTEYPGAGDLFAVASADPFDYTELSRDRQWDVTLAFSDGLAAGDPYAVALDLVALTLPEGYTDFTYDVVRYLVFHAPLTTNATGESTPEWCATFNPAIYGDRWTWIADALPLIPTIQGHPLSSLAPGHPSSAALGRPDPAAEPRNRGEHSPRRPPVGTLTKPPNDPRVPQPAVRGGDRRPDRWRRPVMQHQGPSVRRGTSMPPRARTRATSGPASRSLRSYL